jgi:hypothetical protein
MVLEEILAVTKGLLEHPSHLRVSEKENTYFNFWLGRNHTRMNPGTMMTIAAI